jgi:hypothetical protein
MFFGQPYGAAFDSAGNLVAVDHVGNRVGRFSLATYRADENLASDEATTTTASTIEDVATTTSPETPTIE